MSRLQIQNFTDETGEQAMLKVSPEEVHTVIISGTAGSDDIDLEICVDNASKTVKERFKLETNVLSSTAPYIKKIDSPVNGIGIDIDGNVSNSIIVRVLSAQQG